MTFAELMRNEFGYECITTFWDDFTIAERFGFSAVKETYKRVFNEWKGDYKYLTELSIVLNHKIWQKYETNPQLAKVYNDLWLEIDKYCGDTFEGEAAHYYFEKTD